MPSELAPIMAVGMSHKSAPVHIRERLALDEEGVRRHLVRLRAEGVCAEAFILSTCNRVELYAVPHDGAAEKVRGWLSKTHGSDGIAIEPHLYWRDGREAVFHLFRVAASLDSMVVGEPQILGQVKEAVRIAQEAGALGEHLGRLARATFGLAKRVRTETAIGRFRVGVGNAGVDLALQIFGDLHGRRALLIGAGKMGQQVAKALLQAGLAELIVANRTRERAAQVQSAKAISLDGIPEALGQVDIVIGAAASAEPLVGPDDVRLALKARRYRPLFLVDLAVPRNIDPRVAELEEAYLFNVDDLTQVLDRGRQARESASLDAERIIAEEVERYFTNLRAVEAGPAIGRMTRQVEALRLGELARSKRLVDALGPEHQEELEAMTRALAKKILDGPIRAIREAARDGDTERLDMLVRQWEKEP